MTKKITRRSFIQFSVTGLAATTLFGFELGTNAQAQGAALSGKNTLTVYFSHTGTTRHVAKQIHSRVGGDIAEVTTAKPYSTNDGEVHRVARGEKMRGFRPTLSTTIPDPTPYDVVFIGYPCWWHTLPMAMFTALESVDLSGKTIIPFTTHGGSGWGEGLSDLQKLAPQAKRLEGLSLYGSRARSTSSSRILNGWLSDLGYQA